MNLLIDIGNTRAKIAVCENSQIITHKLFTPDMPVCDLELLQQQYPKLNKCIISSTTPIQQSLISYLNKTYTKVIELTGNTALPFQNLYQTKNTQGPDRLAAIAGAYSLYPNQNVLVIDAGSALTFDFINNKGQYLGGNISPGLEMRFKALHTFTQKLPLLNIPNDIVFLGNNTETAIQAGVVNGVINEIEGYIEKTIAQNQTLTIVITGGDANYLANKLKYVIFVQLQLVLTGLNTILEYNA